MDLNEFIIRHDGVLSARQARLHLNTSAIGRRLSSGKWTAVTPGVYLVAGHHRSARAQARIAALSVGDHAVLGGAAAVWWLGITDDPPSRHLVYSAAHGRHARASSTAHVRQRNLQPCDITVVDGLRVTSREMSVLDAALTLGICVIDAALLRGFVTLSSLEATHERYPARDRGHQSVPDPAAVRIEVGGRARCREAVPYRHRPPPARGRLTVRSDPETEITYTLTRRPRMSVARDTVGTHNMFCTRT